MAEQRKSRTCPLCHGSGIRSFVQVRASRYFRCETCRLTYLAPDQRLTPEEEFERYKLHRNDPTDERYRAFLRRLADPLLERIEAGARGLDYGCGPAPVLSHIFQEHGHEMYCHDPFFVPHEEVLSHSYDFITCSETAEHFFFPGQEFDRLNRMLRPHGWLGVMTQFQEDDSAFPNWHYVRDPTHVCFYHRETMEWIAESHHWNLDFPGKNVALFYKCA